MTADQAPELNEKAQEILEAASDVFMAQGFGAASMDAIAKAAGASKATLYAYFPTKERLFAAVVQAECRRFGALVGAAFEGTDLRAALIEVASQHIRLVLSPKGMAAFRIVVAEAARLPELGRAFWEAGPKTIHRRLAERLERASALGEIAAPSPFRAAADLLALARAERHIGCALLAEPTPDEEEIGRMAEHAVDAFLRAYAPAR